MSPAVSPSDAGIRSGVAFGLLAYTMWGMFPVYFVWTSSAAPLEVLAHRVLWAVPFGALIVSLRGQWRDVANALADRAKLVRLALAAASISVNWLTYIWAIQQERIFETSLGYYINPLMYVAIGVLAFGERLRRLQGAAVALATVGVAFLTFSGGTFPWVAVVLGSSFTLYGVIRKQVAIGAMPGLFIETLMLFPLAALWMSWYVAQGGASITSGDGWLAALLILGGPVTVLPLMFFAIAARRLTLTAIGFLQFLAPTLQFLTGVYYGEPLTTAKLACFAFIWTAVAVFSYDVLRRGRQA
ncbi:MAG: EamA family transporter RarD [Proteobacteria bacterium]|nr:EamA family transporter RarD [Pseudomonadota bacterium]